MVKTYSSNFVHNVNTIKQFNPIDLPGLLENIQLCPVLSGVSHTITTTATTTSTMITTTGVTGGGLQGCWDRRRTSKKRRKRRKRMGTHTNQR